MFCRYCGNELPEDAKFCNSCGKSVFDASPPPSDLQIKEVAKKDYKEPAALVQPTPKMSYKQVMEADAAYKKAQNKELVRKINIISGIIAAIAVIIGVTYIYTDSKKLKDAFGPNDHDTGNNEKIIGQSEPASGSDSSKDSKAEVMYEELIGYYTYGPANDITSSRISIDIYDTTLEISHGSYRGGLGTFDVVFESKDKWPKLENNSIQFTAEEEFWDCTYQLTLTFIPASESSTGSDTIYLKGSELFDDCVYVRDSGDYEYDNWTDYGSSDDNWPDEEYYDDNSIVYVDQYAHNDIYVNHKNPVGYFERYTEDGSSGGLEIVGSEANNFMTFNFHLNPGQTGYYGYNWVEPDFAITIAWPKNLSSHIYAIKLGESKYLRIGMYGTFFAIKMNDSYDLYDILIEDATTNYGTTIMTDNEISGTYYCVYQEEYVGE